MSATDTNNKHLHNSTNKLSANQINPSYTVRVICCVIFIFLTEICLAHYIYRLINSEIRNEYVSKADFKHYFINEIRMNDLITHDQILKILNEYNLSRNQNASYNNNVRLKRETRNSHHRSHNILPTPNGDPYMDANLPPRDQEAKVPSGNVNNAAANGGAYVWMPGSSRIPVSSFYI